MTSTEEVNEMKFDLKEQRNYKNKNEIRRIKYGECSLDVLNMVNGDYGELFGFINDVFKWISI